MDRPRHIIYLIFPSLILTGLAIGLLYGIPKSRAASNAYNSTIKEADRKTKQRASEDYGKLPLSFVENKGQTDARVKFMSGGGGYNLFLTSDEAVLVLTRSRKKTNLNSKEAADSKSTLSQQPAIEQRILRM